MSALLPEVNRVLKPVGVFACFTAGGGGKSTNFAWLAVELDKHLDFFHALVWDKSARGDGMGWRYRRNYEFVYVAHKRGGKIAWNEDRPARPNVMRFRPVKNDVHPTIKPPALMSELILNHTTMGDLVVDPFAGSGTTLVAAQDLQRRYIGCDLSAEYVALANRRLALPYTLPMFAEVTEAQPARARLQDCFSRGNVL